MKSNIESNYFEKHFHLSVAPTFPIISKALLGKSVQGKGSVKKLSEFSSVILGHYQTQVFIILEHCTLYM